jgi:hypothetical protein
VRAKLDSRRLNAALAYTMEIPESDRIIRILDDVTEAARWVDARTRRLWLLRARSGDRERRGCETFNATPQATTAHQKRLSLPENPRLLLCVTDEVVASPDRVVDVLGPVRLVEGWLRAWCMLKRCVSLQNDPAPNNLRYQRQTKGRVRVP